ncbi:alkylmercury lyase [Streptomyces hygroscopicus subsp. limoneus]|nr:alkylmercury lyase [Streptomyces hygroscopicus subsp. limoneus]
MDIELLYFAGCPNWPVARDRLGQALDAAGVSGAQVVLRAVESERDVAATGFAGSLTFRVDGRDLFPVPEAAPALSCRVYATPEGLAGVPTVDQLAARSAAAS